MTDVVQTPRGRIEYRSIGEGPAILLLNGGHTACSSPFEHEQMLVDHGFRIIAPSRPGYGRTPSSTGRSAEDAADAMVELLDALGVDRAVVFGIAAGGRTALQLAGRHPGRVAKLILESAVTCEPWPARNVLVKSYLLFGPATEWLTWLAFRILSRIAPKVALRALMKPMSLVEPDKAIDHMKPETRERVLSFFRTQRSRAGFLNDVRHEAGDLGRVASPTLLIAAMYDRAVAARHSEAAAERIKGARFLIVPAESHLIWFSPYMGDIEQKIISFLS